LLKNKGVKDIMLVSFTLLKMIAMALVLIGSLNWGLVGLFDFNLVQAIGALTHVSVINVVYMLVALSAVFLLFRRDTYLPFLGKSAFPCGALAEKIPDKADTTVQVQNVKPGSNVVFWAAEPSDKVINHPLQAYDRWANSGVTRSDEAGVATLHVRRPGQYKVPPFGRTLPIHVHYRVCYKNGMLGPVKTVII
jgi:uncharacterized membrane protein YuzA (DUF378 family)